MLRESSARVTDQVRVLAMDEERDRLARELHDRVNSPVACTPELRPDVLSAELGSEDGAFTPPSGGALPPPCTPRDRPRPKGRGFSLS